MSIWSLPIFYLPFLYDWLNAKAMWLGLFVTVLWAATLALALLLFTAGELVFRRRNGKDRAFADAPAEIPQYGVEVVFKSRGNALGADRGVAWFEDGLLGFSGERTSFLLAYEDFVWSDLTGFNLVTAGRRDLPLNLREQGALSIRPMWGSGANFRRQLRALIRERKASSRDRQWPPLRPYQKRESLLKQ